MSCQLPKEDTSSEPCLKLPLCRSAPCPWESSTFGANWKRGPLLDSATGSCWSPARRKGLLDGCSSPTPGATGSYLDLSLPTGMCGRKTQPLKVLGSSSGSELFNGTAQQIGMLSGQLHGSERLTISPQISVFGVILRLRESEWIILFLCELTAFVMSSGARLELERVGGPGMKAGTWLTLRILAPSGGAATRVSQMLSSMNFEARSESPTSFGGWTATLSVWRQREELNHWLPARFGLLPIWILEIGTSTWMEPPGMPSLEDLL